MDVEVGLRRAPGGPHVADHRFIELHGLPDRRKKIVRHEPEDFGVCSRVFAFCLDEQAAGIPHQRDHVFFMER